MADEDETTAPWLDADSIEAAVSRIAPWDDDQDTAPHSLTEAELDALLRMSKPRRRAHTITSSGS